MKDSRVLLIVVLLIGVVAVAAWAWNETHVDVAYEVYVKESGVEGCMALVVEYDLPGDRKAYGLVHAPGWTVRQPEGVAPIPSPFDATLRPGHHTLTYVAPQGKYADGYNTSRVTLEIYDPYFIPVKRTASARRPARSASAPRTGPASGTGLWRARRS